MIRINLLPIKDTIRKETSKRQLILFGFLLVALLVVFYFLYASKAGTRDELLQANATRASSIEVLKKQVADVEKLTKEKQLLKEQIDVLDSLEAGRGGPVRVLDEVQLILSVPRNELEASRYEKRGWNPKWDPTRLWFNSFGEKAGDFNLAGGARTSDDVAEFLQRLSTSVFFEDVRLLSVDQRETKGFSYVVFQLRGQLTYSIKPKKKPEEAEGKAGGKEGDKGEKPAEKK